MFTHRTRKKNRFRISQNEQKQCSANSKYDANLQYLNVK